MTRHAGTLAPGQSELDSDVAAAELWSTGPKAKRIVGLSCSILSYLRSPRFSHFRILVCSGSLLGPSRAKCTALNSLELCPLQTQFRIFLLDMHIFRVCNLQVPLSSFSYGFFREPLPPPSPPPPTVLTFLQLSCKGPIYAMAGAVWPLVDVLCWPGWAT
jgi:hypothetical protein